MLRDIYFIFYLFVILSILGRKKHVLIWLVLLTLAHLPFLKSINLTFQLFFLAFSVRKACMILSTGLIIFSSISVGDCINLMKKMRIHRNLIIPIAICFRFIPTLIFEAGIIRDALKVRRLYSAKKIFRHPLATFELFLSTFLFRIFALGEELVFSLSTRGLDFKGDRFYREVGFTYRDMVFFFATILYLAFVLFSPVPEFEI